MTQREMILAGGVGLAIAVLGGNYLFRSVRAGFDKKQQQIDRLEANKSKLEDEIDDGFFDRENISKVTYRSLPSNVERAAADYREWMISLGREAGLQNPAQSVRPSPSPEKGVYRKFHFTLRGRGTIENAVKLLYEYYRKDYLHRISSLTIDLIPNEPYMLDITLESEVLALDLASPTQAPPGKSDLRLATSLENYRTVIINRNLFAPANNPPRWASSNRAEATLGSRWTFQPNATDPDPKQTVRYELVGPLPRGMNFDRSSGALSWTPSQKGEYQVQLKAIDSGLPQQSALKTLVVRVVDPPARPPVQRPREGLDVASQAFVSALVTGRNGPEAWVRSRLDGKTIFLKKGDELTLGSIKGTVVDVGANYIELDTNGQRWTVGLDESLADAFQRSSID